MSERTLNVELLAKVRDHILEEPRRYDQGTYASQSDQAPCGTAACLAGWADHLANGTDVVRAVEREGTALIHERAREAIGLNEEEAEIMFSACPKGDWPEPFGSAFDKAEDDEDAARMARVAADYIDYIIKTGKVED